VAANWSAAQTPPPANPKQEEMPDLSNAPPSWLDTRLAVFKIDSSYNAQTPDDTPAANQQAVRSIAARLKLRHIDPGHTDMLRLNTGNGAFYISSVPGHMIFYVDVIGIVNFAGSVNLLTGKSWPSATCGSCWPPRPKNSACWRRKSISACVSILMGLDPP